MSGNEKIYRYPTINRVLYTALALPLLIALTGLWLYGFFAESDKLSLDALSLIVGMLISTVIVIGLLFNYYHIGTIIVNEREIICLKPRGRVVIPWTQVAQIYYKVGRGRQLTTSPFFTVYILSREKNDLIIFNRDINDIDDLLKRIRERVSASLVSYVSVRQVLWLVIGMYWPFRMGNRRISSS